MDKVKAKYTIGLQYTKIVEGTISFGAFEFENTEKALSPMLLAKQISVIRGRDYIRIKDKNKVHTISFQEFDNLYRTILLKGDDLW